MRKTIQYYRKSVYGNSLEYVVDKGDAAVLAQLTGKKTIDSVTRELIRDLSGGRVTFEEVLAPGPLPRVEMPVDAFLATFR